MTKVRNIVSILIASALMIFAGCSDISNPRQDDSSKEKSALVTLSLGGVARTILPDVDLTSGYTFTVTTTAQGSSEAKTHLSSVSYNALTAANAISLEAGTYTFTVTAKNSSTGTTLKGSTTKTIAAGSNTVSVKLADATESGKGTVEVTLSYTKNAGVKAIYAYWGETNPSASGADSTNLYDSETDGTATFSQSDVVAGKTYYIAFYLYDSEEKTTLLGSCYDTVYVVAGYNSKGTEKVKLSRLAGFFPEAGETNAYADTYLEITFDEAPTINRDSTGTVRIYDSSDAPVDTIKPAAETMYGYGVGGNSSYGKINAQYQLIQVIDEKTVRIIPHHGTTADKATLLENGKKYYVLIDNGLITGKIGGEDFTGITDKTKWTFTTGSAPSVSGNTLTVGDDKEFLTVQGAFNYLMKSGATGDWQINIDQGTYYERIFYSGKANITMSGQGSATYGTDVEIQWTNQDGGEGTTLWNTGSRGRNVFYYKGGNLVLENISLVNTATRKTNSYGENDGSSSDSAGGKNQAETLMFDSTGFLAAYNSNFASRQDTILLNSGRAWFYKCYVEGDVDYIWGSATAALFEECEIESLLTEKTAYITETRVGSVGASMVGKGFVFLNSKIIGSGTANSAYLSRLASGNAKSSPSKDTYDQVAFINNTFETSAKVSANLWSATDAAYPRFIAKDSDGNVNVGWKTYGNTGVTAVTQEYAGEITESLYSTEYNGRYAILNRLYNVDYSAYQTNSAKWDLATLENRFGATADASKSNTFTEPDTSASKTVKWDFTSIASGTTIESKTGTIPASTGAGTLYVDASSGKLATRGTDAQFNNGTKAYIPAAVGDTISVVMYNTSYSLGGATISAKSTELTVTTSDLTTYDGVSCVALIATGDGQYIYTITLEPGSSVSESDDTISATTLWKVEDYWTDTSDVSVSSSTTQGKVTLLASSEKTITISKSQKSIDSTDFTHVLKFGGSASSSATTPTARALQFKLSGAATIKVYAVTASSGSARDLMLTDGTNSLGTKSVNEAAVYAYSVSSAGTYYLYSNNSGINIYGIYFDFGSSSTGASAVSVSGNSSVTAGNSITLTANVTGTPKTASYTWTITDGTSYASFASTTGTTTKTTDTGTVTLYGIATGTAKVTVKVDDVTSEAKSVTVNAAGSKTILLADTPIGYASQGTATWVTAPESSKIVTVSNAKDLRDYAKKGGYLIKVNGMIDMTTDDNDAAKSMLPASATDDNAKLGEFISTHYGNWTGTKYSSWSDWRTAYAASINAGDADWSSSSSSSSGTGVNSMDGYEWQLYNDYKNKIMIRPASSTTIIGIDANSGIKGGSFYLEDVSNIQIRNLTIRDAFDPFPHHEQNDGWNAQYDGITIKGTCDQIWIDHCSFEDTISVGWSAFATVTMKDGVEDAANHKNMWQTYDGMLDIAGTATNVTISYCTFKDHDKVMLLGNNEKDTGTKTITLHHCAFIDCVQRLPMVRMSSVHIFNTYYSFENTGYSRTSTINVRDSAKVNSESNYFESNMVMSYTGSDGGTVYYHDDYGISSSTNKNIMTSQSSAVFTIPYSYTPDTAENVKAIVTEQAGAGYTLASN